MFWTEYYCCEQPKGYVFHSLDVVIISTCICLIVWNIHIYALPKANSSHLAGGRAPKGNSSSNHPFSGANCCSFQGENLYESMNPSAKVLNPWTLNSMNQPINLVYFAHDAKAKRTNTPQADALEINTINTHLLASLTTKLYILDCFKKKHTMQSNLQNRHFSVCHRMCVF